MLNLVCGPVDSTGGATYEDARTHLREPGQKMDKGTPMSAEVVTAIDATVDPERERDLLDGYRQMIEAPKPNGQSYPAW